LKILIDTNIIIQLEDHRVVANSFAELYKLAVSNNCQVLYHPACVDDILRDVDEERKKITLSKMGKYGTLQNPAVPTVEFLQIVGEETVNDAVDNIQLFQVIKGYVDVFITEDKGIFKKSRAAGVKSKVLSVSDALQLMKNTFGEHLPTHPVLKSCSVREIEGYISTSFFDSVRARYDGFDHWFHTKCVQQDRRCYALVLENMLHAILIYNIEVTDDHQIVGVYGQVVKMCTFKVDETAQGYKMGQLFLNKMFEYCIKNNIKHLYLTVYPDQPELIGLLREFGFVTARRVGKPDTEITMLRCMDKLQNTANYNMSQTHPFYANVSNYNKFVIPIQPQFYSTLFKDGAFREPTLFDTSYPSLSEIEGNSIRKAYICKAKRKIMKAGDILLFYSSHSPMAIEPIGILDEVKYLSNIEDIMEAVKKITVYKQVDIENMLAETRNLTVMLFRLVSYLDKPVSIEEIRKLNCFSNKFQTITQVHGEDYNNLKSKGYFDERYIINQT
jgi:ribosomal protein S18 acetylase RimI-like enzyme